MSCAEWARIKVDFYFFVVFCFRFLSLLSSIRSSFARTVVVDVVIIIITPRKKSETKITRFWGRNRLASFIDDNRRKSSCNLVCLKLSKIELWSEKSSLSFHRRRRGVLISFLSIWAAHHAHYRSAIAPEKKPRKERTNCDGSVAIKGRRAVLIFLFPHPKKYIKINL